METPKVFISYSHESAKHSENVLQFSNSLRNDGIESMIDQYIMCPEDGWPRWIDKNIRDANFVLMICTNKYYRRIMGEEKTLGVVWEGQLIYQYIYEAGSKNLKFIPILFENEKTENIPMILKGTTYYYSQPDEEYNKLYRRLTNQPLITMEPVPKLKPLESKPKLTNFFDRHCITQLVSFVGKGDYASIEQLVQLGIDLNGTDESGILTPLETAIVGKNINMVKYLIKSGADVNFLKHDYSDPPLFFAIATEMEDIVMELVINGANINFLSKITKVTPLSFAIGKGMFDLVKKMKDEFNKNKQ